MTFPGQAPAALRPPNYAVGQLLNAVLMGSGFTYLGRWGWHLGWAVIGAVLVQAGVILSAASQVFALLALPVLGWIGQFVHYHVLYRAQAAQGFRPPLDNALKVGLIVGHFGLAFLMTGVLAAVLIPNLLSARTRATQAAERAAAQQVYVQVMVQQVDGTLKAGACPELPAPPTSADIQSCAVSLADPANPQVDITFGSGRSLHLPSP